MRDRRASEERVQQGGRCNCGADKRLVMKRGLLGGEASQAQRRFKLGQDRLVLAISVAALLALVCAACIASRREQETVLTYWDGAAADEPGYAEEAANQIEDGTYAAHVGFWERPGFWNNRAVADQGEGQMDERMFHLAASRKNWETAGTDFWDAKSLYSESEDVDVDQDMTGSEYDNSWPGTGQNLYGWHDLSSDSDGYDGQWPIQPLDMEATDDAAVSQNALGGFKAVGPARLQTLVQCEACNSGTGCVAGCRVARTRTHEAKNDRKMVILDKVLRPTNRFKVERLVAKLLKAKHAKLQKKSRHAMGTAQPSAVPVQKGATHTLSGTPGMQGVGKPAQAQVPGRGWFLGCNPGSDFSSCVRESLQKFSRALTPKVRPFYNRRQQNPGCKPGPGFSQCIEDNLGLDQPNLKKKGYWPIVHDDKSTFLHKKGMNVDSWFDPKADAGATIYKAVDKQLLALGAGQAQASQLHLVPGVGLAPRHSARAPSTIMPSSSRRTLSGARHVQSVHVPQDERTLSAADEALASAGRQLSREAAQRAARVAAARQRAVRKGRRVIEALDANAPLEPKRRLKHDDAALVEALHRQQRPLSGRNFRTKGYWPLTAHTSYLESQGIKVDGSPLDEPEMPEQKIDYSSFGSWWATVMGNGHRLSRVGIHVDTMEETKPHPHKLSRLGVMV